jgi:hypothetical protein
MGKIESIQEIVSPIANCLQANCHISCNIVLKTTAVLFENFYNARETHLLLNIDDNNCVSVYFLACDIPPLYHLPWWDVAVAKKQIAFFPGPDVFHFLGIKYSYIPKGYLEDFQDLARLICDHAPKIIRAFSQENRQKTFDALNSIGAANRMKGNQ